MCWYVFVYVYVCLYVYLCVAVCVSVHVYICKCMCTRIGGFQAAQIFKHSMVQRFNHSIIQQFKHSSIQRFNHFRDSNASKVQTLTRSDVCSNHSEIQTFKLSIIEEGFFSCTRGTHIVFEGSTLNMSNCYCCCCCCCFLRGMKHLIFEVQAVSMNSC